MIPRTKRYMPPAINASAHVSPIVPAVVPRNMAFTSTLSPALRLASGVAVVTASYVNVVIFPVNDINRKHLAPNAGFMKFCPKPPKTCFTTMIAKKLPITGSQNGTSAGRFNASNNPVNAADRSMIVFLRSVSFSKAASKNTQLITVIRMITNALIPKL